MSNCRNCGGVGTDKRGSCVYCGSPIKVISLPKLKPVRQVRPSEEKLTLIQKVLFIIIAIPFYIVLVGLMSKHKKR